MSNQINTAALADTFAADLMERTAPAVAVMLKAGNAYAKKRANLCGLAREAFQGFIIHENAPADGEARLLRYISETAVPMTSAGTEGGDAAYEAWKKAVRIAAEENGYKAGFSKKQKGAVVEVKLEKLPPAATPAKGKGKEAGQGPKDKAPAGATSEEKSSAEAPRHRTVTTVDEIVRAFREFGEDGRGAVLSALISELSRVELREVQKAVGSRLTALEEAKAKPKASEPKASESEQENAITAAFRKAANS